MSERDPRRRRKKKEGLKKEDRVPSEDASSHIPERPSDWRKDSVDLNHDDTAKIRHEPSKTAKIVFFILFSLLAIVVGAVFISLHGADRGPIEILEEHEEPHEYAELLHGELDEGHGGKEFEIEGLHEELDHGDEDEEHGHDDDEEEHGHEDDHDDHDEGESEISFLSDIMGLFGVSSTPEPVSEESTEAPSLSQADQEEEESAQITEHQHIPEEPSQPVDEEEEAKLPDVEKQEVEPEEEEETSAAPDISPSPPSEDAEGGGDDEDDGVGKDEEEEEAGEQRTDVEDDVDISASWVTEHLPASTREPTVEQTDADEGEDEEDEDEEETNLRFEAETSTSAGKIADLNDETEESPEEADEPEPVESYYEKDDITNEYDYLIKDDLDDAEKILEKEAEEDDYFFWRI